jgi:hypothetical protein
MLPAMQLEGAAADALLLTMCAYSWTHNCLPLLLLLAMVVVLLLLLLHSFNSNAGAAVAAAPLLQQQCWPCMARAVRQQKHKHYLPNRLVIEA